MSLFIKKFKEKKNLEETFKTKELSKQEIKKIKKELKDAKKSEKIKKRNTSPKTNENKGIDWKNEKVLVVLSGGLDSSILITKALKECKEVVAISYDFKQKMVENTNPKINMFQNNPVEIECAKKLCKKLNIKHVIIDCSFMANILKHMRENTNEFNNNMLTKEQPRTNMPYRNLTMLSIALAIAESEKCNYIFTGYQTQDKHGYWDTTEDFVNGINNISSLNPKQNTMVVAPFSLLNKSDEIKLGLELNVDLSNTWSCYNPISTKRKLKQKYLCCGECPACKDRLLNFEKLNIKDPLIYVNKKGNK